MGNDTVGTYNFGVLGVAGFVAPRHLKAISSTGHTLVAACDPHDSVGVLDHYSLHARFFPEIERFDRFLEKQRRKSENERVHYLSICTPNYLHDAHVRMALRGGAHAVCEKPLVINPWNLDQLAELERESPVARVYTVLQLRLLPVVQHIKERVREGSHRPEIVLSYVTRRGPWYHASWKGSEEKSGGLVTNIGIHFFDLLMWMFGTPQRSELHVRDPDRWAGFLELEDADVRWYLSIRQRDLPERYREEGRAAFRSVTVDGDEIDFSSGFTDLHTRVYEDILAGGGFGIEDARPSIETVYRIRTSELVSPGAHAHPWLTAAR